MKESFGFTGGVDQFFYLSQSGVSTVPGVDDAKEFAAVQAAMSTIGINDTEQWAIWQILGGILHLGNIQFAGDTKATVSTPENLQWASYLLELEQPQLSRLILNRLITSGRGSAYEVPQNADQAAGMRDAVAKSLYERVFTYLVDKINFAMTPRGGASTPSSGGGRGKFFPSLLTFFFFVYFVTT
jgi:myosin-1